MGSTLLAQPRERRVLHAREPAVGRDNCVRGVPGLLPKVGATTCPRGRTARSPAQAAGTSCSFHATGRQVIRGSSKRRPRGSTAPTRWPVRAGDQLAEPVLHGLIGPACGADAGLVVGAAHGGVSWQVTEASRTCPHEVTSPAPLSRRDARLRSSNSARKSTSSRASGTLPPSTAVNQAR